MKKKNSSTLISLKVEDSLLERLDSYCEETGLSRTAVIARSVRDTLKEYSLSSSPDSLEYLKTNGLWYEWTDYEGNWTLPGCAGVISEREKTTKEQTKVMQQLYMYCSRRWIDTGDFQKVVTCRGVNGLAVYWGFSRLHIDANGQMHEQIEPYLQKTVAAMKRRCTDGMILTDTSDDGTSDYRIIWFVPESSIKGLTYENMLNASKIFEAFLVSGR